MILLISKIDSLAYLLSESHLTVHTYPEYHLAYLDIFCYNPNFNPNMTIRELKEAFEIETALLIKIITVNHISFLIKLMRIMTIY